MRMMMVGEEDDVTRSAVGMRPGGSATVVGARTVHDARTRKNKNA